MMQQAITKSKKYICGILVVILSVAFFLLTYKLDEYMIFIGDFGWFYLEARDIVLNKNIPLVGIASSHPWIHQGPFWTYILAVGLAITDFNPLSGAYIGVLFGMFSIIGIFIIGKTFFSTKVGLVAILLYATSPLIIIHTRMPYHTTPIPLFMMCYMYCLYKWVSGNIKFFPLTLFFLAVLYNFELATVLLILPVIIFLGLGFYKKSQYFYQLISKKNLLQSLLFASFPMIPILIYDSTHGFPQTVKFGMWMGYRILRIFGYPALHANEQPQSIQFFLQFSYSLLQKLLFLQDGRVALILFIISLMCISYCIFYKFIGKNGKKMVPNGEMIVLVVLIIPLAGYIVGKTPSEAYVPIFFPTIILIFAYLVNQLLSHKKLIVVGIIVLVVFVISNTKQLLESNYLMGKGEYAYGPTFSQRNEVAQIISDDARGKPFSIKIIGDGSMFESSDDNYLYLLYWKKANVKNNATLNYSIAEIESKITVTNPGI